METTAFIFQLIESIGIIAASCTAIYGVIAWRKQLKWQKKLDLAEQVLAAFYEAEHVIKYIRSPSSGIYEGASRPKDNGSESDNEKAIRDRAFITIERYQNHLSVFSKLRAFRYRFMALYGNDAGKPFDDIENVLFMIRNAASDLSRIWLERSFRPQDQELLGMMKYNEAIIWSPSPNELADPLLEKISGCISKIEEYCRPLLSK